jgi:hypothetical protein
MAESKKKRAPVLLYCLIAFFLFISHGWGPVHSRAELFEAIAGSYLGSFMLVAIIGELIRAAVGWFKKNQDSKSAEKNTALDNPPPKEAREASVSGSHLGPTEPEQEKAPEEPHRGSRGTTATVNLKEGTRRLALLLGVIGAILGGFGSYMELQTTVEQRASNVKFEQLVASDVVQQERKNCLDPPPGYDKLNSQLQPNRLGIESISWTEDCRVGTIETGSDFLFALTPPSLWFSCLLAASFPFLGFLVPWGAIRAVGWVGVGFIEKKQSSGE